MRVKAQAPAEDPETKAKRELEEARAESDRTSALQSLLDRKTRRLARIFGARPQVASPRMGGFGGLAGISPSTGTSSSGVYGGFSGAGPFSGNFSGVGGDGNVVRIFN